MSDDKCEKCNSTLILDAELSEAVCPSCPDISIPENMEEEINKTKGNEISIPETMEEEINQTKGNVHCGECDVVVEEDGECLSCDMCKVWYHNRCNRNPLPPELYNLLSEAPDNIKWCCDRCLTDPKWKRIFESSYSDYEDNIYSPNEEVVKVKKKRKTMLKKSIKTESGDYHQNERSNRFSCDLCGKTFMSVSSLLTHKRFHSHTLPYVCNVCNRGFPRIGSLKAHKKICSNEKPFVCTECGKRFNDKGNLERHSLYHKDKPHKCEQCGNGFSLIHELKRHMMKHSEEKSFKPFICSICGGKYMRENSLKQHMLTHTDTGGKSYECKKCSAKFDRRDHLKAHTKMHNIRDYICELCGEKCSDSGALKKHILSHSKENEYTCSHCDYKSSLKTSFRQHMIMHFEVKPFACTVCGFGFFTQTTLNGHMHTHAGKKLYTCEVCGKDCRRSHILKVHMASHTGEEIMAKKTNLNRSLHEGYSPDSNIKENNSNESKSIPSKDIVPADINTLENNNITSNIHKPQPNSIRETAAVSSSHLGPLITPQSSMHQSPSPLQMSSNAGRGVHMQNYSNTGHTEALSTAIRSQNDLPYFHSSPQNTINESDISQNLGSHNTTNPQNLHQTSEPLRFVRNPGRGGAPPGPPSAQYYSNSGLSPALTHTAFSSLGELESREHEHHIANVHQFH